jgi:adenylyl-sulfate kinase
VTTENTPQPAGEIRWHEHAITRKDRWANQNSRGCTLWLTGLSGAGKSTIANAAAHQLFASGIPVYVLDGDNLRHGLNVDLGFSDEDRAENVRRVGEVALLLADAGFVVFVPIISPFSKGRQAVRERHESADLGFAEVFIATSVEECAERDTKGLYAKAAKGELTGLTGVDAPYEAPRSPEMTLLTSQRSVDTCTEELLSGMSHLWS